jgi:hypothetical protein
MICMRYKGGNDQFRFLRYKVSKHPPALIGRNRHPAKLGDTAFSGSRD